MRQGRGLAVCIVMLIFCTLFNGGWCFIQKNRNHDTKHIKKRMNVVKKTMVRCGRRVPPFLLICSSVRRRRSALCLLWARRGIPGTLNWFYRRDSSRQTCICLIQSIDVSIYWEKECVDLPTCQLQTWSRWIQSEVLYFLPSNSGLTLRSPTIW